MLNLILTSGIDQPKRMKICNHAWHPALAQHILLLVLQNVSPIVISHESGKRPSARMARGARATSASALAKSTLCFELSQPV